MRVPVVAIVCTALLWLGCARNPVTGRPEMVLVSTETEIEAGREARKEVEAVMGLADHESARAYVRAIGERLAVHSPRQDVEYSFDVVDTPEPNAFALPGGPVYVSRGLLAYVNSEDELAGVIGHEIGHIAARHVVSRVTWTTPFAVVFGIPSAIVGMVSQTLGAVVAAPGRLAGGLTLARHSRQQEHQADQIGMQLAAAAGYEPIRLADILHTLEREDALRRGEERRADFFDSHPNTPDRIERIRNGAADLSRAAEPPLEERPGLLARLDGLRVGVDPSDGVFVEDDFLHPPLGFAMQFPSEWDRRNLPRFVVAVHPDQDKRAFAVLEIVDEGDDPMKGPHVDELKPEQREALKALRINGLPAATLHGQARGTVYDITWVAWAGHLYRIACAASAEAYPSVRDRFVMVTRSFRPVRDADVARIREARLRSRRARAGETVAGFAARTGSDWEAEELAIANAKEGPGTPLPAAFPTKLSLLQAYTGKRLKVHRPPNP